MAVAPALLEDGVPCHPMLVPRGLHASYFSNASRDGFPERGLYGAWPGETRVDSKVAFGNGWPDLPLYYLNDQRFNHPRATQEPSSMEWRGLLLVSEEGADLELYLAGRGVAAETLIDGFRVVALESTQDQAIGHVRARSGLRQLTVRAASPSGIPKTFQAGISDPSSGNQRPFGRADVLLTRASWTRLQADRILRLLSVMCDIGALVTLVIAGAIGLRETIKAAPGLGWQTTVVRTLPLLACAEALWFAQRTWGRVEFLAWGAESRTARLAQLIPALMALSQFAAIVAILPYSERLVLPFYALILVYAAVPIGALFQRVPPD